MLLAIAKSMPMLHAYGQKLYINVFLFIFYIGYIVLKGGLSWLKHHQRIGAGTLGAKIVSVEP
jgi:hypothetical protein